MRMIITSLLMGKRKVEIYVPSKKLYFWYFSHNLKIMGLMTSDSGIFQCVAENPAGNIQTSASLKVLSGEFFLLLLLFLVILVKKEFCLRNFNNFPRIWGQTYSNIYFVL